MNRAKQGLITVCALAALIYAASSLAPLQARGDNKALSTARLVDSAPGTDWSAYGRTFGEQHFSPLTQIRAENVSRLGLQWSMDLGLQNSVSQPLEIAGVLYFVTGYGVVHAVDAVTGAPLWKYDSQSWRTAGKKLRDGWGSRGIAWWNGKIYVGTQDGRLIAINAKTGAPVWSAMTVDPGDANYITGAPRVYDGKVVVGFGGADVGPARGYVTTYDAETGKQLWRWYTVPGNPALGFENAAMAMAAKTWSGEWWKYGGGGTAWNAISYDPETDTVLVGVGNGSPWNIKARSQGKGDNLFLCSIVALDGKTGQYKWHYQINPGETWDYTATMDMALADLDIDGQRRKVLMTAPKNGFFYVIDRTNGKLISAESITKVNWASKIDIATGRPVENPGARYPDGSTFLMWPKTAHSWQPMAYDPERKLAFIPVLQSAETWTDSGLANDVWRKESPYSTGQFAAIRNTHPKVDDPDNETSWLKSWDVRTQKPAWSVKTPGPVNGGVMATAGGLVFQGQVDGRFNAYAADTGRLVWSYQANAPVIAPPITFVAHGRQYVSVLTGMGLSAAIDGAQLKPFGIDFRMQARRVLTFALDGTASLPPRVSPGLKPIADPDYAADQVVASQGATVYNRRCVQCHGGGVIAGGAAPDLRTSSIPLSAPGFRSVVHGGAMLPLGMPIFDELSDADLAAVRQYIRSKGADWRSREAMTSTKTPPAP